MPDPTEDDAASRPAPAVAPRRHPSFGGPGARGGLGRNVIALAVVSFFTDVSSEMIYPLLPLYLTTVIGATPAALGLVEGAAEATASLLKLASGWWSDQVRRRKPLVVGGYLLASVARPLVAVAATVGAVLAVRLADRVGKGIRTSPRDALIADSVDPAARGRAFGFHRAADHAGAVVGPLVAFALLQGAHAPLRLVFALAAVPAAVAMVVVIAGVAERGGAPPRTNDAAGAAVARHPENAAPATSAQTSAAPPLPRAFWGYVAAVTLFTLGNSTDAFLLLRAAQLGVPVALVPVLWAAFHVVKAASSTPAGALSDRVGRRPLIVGGWLLYAAVYLLFGRATEPWHAWALFGAYGLFFGLTEGVEKALVADLVPPARRGAAYGWYHFGLGAAALPASALFGIVWTRSGPATAFTLGAVLAALAAAALVALVPPPART